MHMFRSSPARIVSRYHLRAIVRCAAVTVRLLPLLELRYLAPRLTVRASPLDIPLSLVLWASRLAPSAATLAPWERGNAVPPLPEQPEFRSPFRCVTRRVLPPHAPHLPHALLAPRSSLDTRYSILSMLCSLHLYP